MNLADELVEDCLDYLDELRDSGRTNMFGATPYLMDEFDLSRKEAMSVLRHWMDTFAARNA